jgi:hypothetical protein
MCDVVVEWLAGRVLFFWLHIHTREAGSCLYLVFDAWLFVALAFSAVCLAVFASCSYFLSRSYFVCHLALFDTLTGAHHTIFS